MRNIVPLFYHTIMILVISMMLYYSIILPFYYLIMSLSLSFLSFCYHIIQSTYCYNQLFLLPVHTIVRTHGGMGEDEAKEHHETPTPLWGVIFWI